MLIILKEGTKKDSADAIISYLGRYDLSAELLEGSSEFYIKVFGKNIKNHQWDDFPFSQYVNKIIHLTPKYILASKKHKEFHEIKIGNQIFSQNSFNIIAGPCSVESEEQIESVCKFLNENNISFIRAGAFKPRTSPYSFQGLEFDGLKILKRIAEKYNIKTVSEVVCHHSIGDVSAYIDICQVGTRNMKNYHLLKELGKNNKPVLLKRGMESTYEEWLLSAEYILSGGNENVILCERGIRTFETHTRNTLDISSFPVLKKLTWLPSISDPSHASGDSRYIEELSLASVMAGANGLMLEIHPDPNNAKSDREQSLDFSTFSKLIKKIRKTREFYESLQS